MKIYELGSCEGIDHRSYAHNLSNCKIKAWKNSNLNNIWTQESCEYRFSSIYIGFRQLYRFLVSFQFQ